MGMVTKSIALIMPLNDNSTETPPLFGNESIQNTTSAIVWPLGVTVGAPIASSVLFFLVITWLYYVDDPGMKRSKKTHLTNPPTPLEQENPNKDNEHLVPLIAKRLVHKLTNQTHHTAAGGHHHATITGGEVFQADGDKTTARIPIKRVSSMDDAAEQRRRTVSDSTGGRAGAEEGLRAAPSETQMLLQHMLMRGGSGRTRLTSEGSHSLHSGAIAYGHDELPIGTHSQTTGHFHLWPLRRPRRSRSQSTGESTGANSCDHETEAIGHDPLEISEPNAFHMARIREEEEKVNVRKNNATIA